MWRDVGRELPADRDYPWPAGVSGTTKWKEQMKTATQYSLGIPAVEMGCTKRHLRRMPDRTIGCHVHGDGKCRSHGAPTLPIEVKRC